MTSAYSKGYSPYSKGSPSQNDQGALRTKAFSHIENIEHNYSQIQNSNPSANQDKIAQIKKKYEKILAKSNNKTNQENHYALSTQNDVGRSVSKFQNFDQNSRWSQYNKSFQTPTPNKERSAPNVADIPEVKNVGSRPYALRQYVNPAKTQVKSHLESNRMTLNAMKSELQSKLKDLSSKTNVTSQLRNPSILRQEKKANEPTSYQAILSKYSKDMSQNRTKNNNTDMNRNYAYGLIQQSQVKPYQKKETLQEKIKETTISSYIPNKLNHNKPNEKPPTTKQLSIISEISNSNHSDMQNYTDSHTKFENKERTQGNYKNSQSYLVVEKPMVTDKYTNWTKNVPSYTDTKQQKPRQQKESQFKLQKLEASQGLSIKRTTTQQNFMNLNKLNLIQGRFQQKQKQYENSRIPQATKYQATKVLPQQKQVSISQSNKSYQAIEQKTQIQKLKEKYNINTNNKYVNPYRQKRSQKSVNSDKNQPKNNQTISKEIEKLDSRIKQIQQNKKDLNINFRPYQISRSVSKVCNISDSNKTSASISNYQKSQSKYSQIGPISSTNNNANVQNNSSTADKSKYNARYQAYLERIKPLYSEITLPEGTKTESNGFAIKLLPVQISHQPEEETQKSFCDLNSKSRMKQYMNKVQLQNRTDTGIQQRKKKLQQKVEINNNVKLLVKTFGQQAVYDEVFRNNKIWFASENKQKKWAQLKNELNSLSVNLSQSELKEAFTLDQSENNPFFSVSDNKCNFKSLAQSYKQAQRHWQQKVLHKFNRTQLQRQGFSTNKIDYDKKGCIQIQDLVRFLNIESGTFLRNRDVSIIFKRMCNNGSKLQFDKMFSLITL